MAQTRCFSCGYVFHGGIPTFDELSMDQARVVTAGTDLSTARDADNNMDADAALLGTTFAGLTANNFCETCLAAIMHNPQAFVSNQHPGHELDQKHNNRGSLDVWCACGHIYDTNVGSGKNNTSWVTVNRMMMIHISKTVTS